jgi:transcriptional regulator with XRE-family HTH domain
MRPPRYTVVAMSRVSRLQPTPIPQGAESLGQRLARLRKERGFTQKELATKTGLIQALISDYERDKLRLNAEMILRFATALEITTDDLLQPGGPKPVRKPSRRVLRRLEQIETLPSPQQTTLLKTIDTFLENAAFRAARRA